MADLPVRILVGHKGIGKSALFKVAMTEDRAKERVAILIQPNDIVDLGVNTSDFLRTIQHWTQGLRKIIASKALASLGVTPRLSERIGEYPGPIIDFLIQTLNDLGPGDYDIDHQDAILQFQLTPRITAYIDDLDRGWQGKSEDITRISALLNSVRISAMSTGASTSR